MFKPHTHGGKYILAALAGATAGGFLVALSTRAVPKMMSGMEEKCMRMMARMMPEMKKGDCKPEDLCQQMMGGMRPAAPHATCESSCES